MVRRYIDELPISGIENSGSDSSFEELNTEDFRIDLINKNNQDNQEVEDNSTLHTPEVYSPENRYDKIEPFEHLNDSMTEENESIPDIVTPPRERKRVRFNPGEKDDAFENLNPWDFKRLVRKLFKEQLPDTYAIKNWKRPAKELVANFIEVLESNVGLASSEVFQQYSQDINTVFPEVSMQKDLQDKIETEVFDLIYNIKKRIKRTKFPSKIWAENLNMEYVYAKGEVIKKRYENELDHAERMERQLLREEEIMNGMLASQERRMLKHKRQLKDNLSELSKSLHPALSTSLANNFGLITDTELSQNNYHYDVAVFNLRLKTNFSQPLSANSTSPSNEQTLLPEIIQNKALKHSLQQRLTNITDPGNTHE